NGLANTVDTACGNRTPSTPTRRESSARACGLGAYPSRSAVARIRETVVLDSCAGSLNAAETAAGDTRARRATSPIVTRPTPLLPLGLLKRFRREKSYPGSAPVKRFGGLTRALASPGRAHRPRQGRRMHDSHDVPRGRNAVGGVSLCTSHGNREHGPHHQEVRRSVRCERLEYQGP